MRLYNNFIGDFLNEETSLKSFNNFCNGKFHYIRGNKLRVIKGIKTLL